MPFKFGKKRPTEPDADDAPPLPGRPGIMSGRKKTSDFDADDQAFATQVPPTGRLAPTAKNFLKRPKKKIGDALGVAAKGAPPAAKKANTTGLRHPSLPPGHPFNTRR